MADSALVAAKRAEIVARVELARKQMAEDAMAAAATPVAPEPETCAVAMVGAGSLPVALLPVALLPQQKGDDKARGPFFFILALPSRWLTCYLSLSRAMPWPLTSPPLPPPLAARCGATLQTSPQGRHADCCGEHRLPAWLTQ